MSHSKQYHGATDHGLRARAPEPHLQPERPHHQLHRQHPAMGNHKDKYNECEADRFASIPGFAVKDTSSGSATVMMTGNCTLQKAAGPREVVKSKFASISTRHAPPAYCGYRDVREPETGGLTSASIERAYPGNSPSSATLFNAPAVPPRNGSSYRGDGVEFGGRSVRDLPERGSRFEASNASSPTVGSVQGSSPVSLRGRPMSGRYDNVHSLEKALRFLHIPGTPPAFPIPPAVSHASVLGSPMAKPAIPPKPSRLDLGNPNRKSLNSKRLSGRYDNISTLEKAIQLLKRGASQNNLHQVGLQTPTESGPTVTTPSPTTTTDPFHMPSSLLSPASQLLSNSSLFLSNLEAMEDALGFIKQEMIPSPENSPVLGARSDIATTSPETAKHTGPHCDDKAWCRSYHTATIPSPGDSPMNKIMAGTALVPYLFSPVNSESSSNDEDEIEDDLDEEEVLTLDDAIEFLTNGVLFTPAPPGDCTGTAGKSSSRDNMTTSTNTFSVSSSIDNNCACRERTIEGRANNASLRTEPNAAYHNDKCTINVDEQTSDPNKLSDRCPDAARKNANPDVNNTLQSSSSPATTTSATTTVTSSVAGPKSAVSTTTAVDISDCNETCPDGTTTSMPPSLSLLSLTDIIGQENKGTIRNQALEEALFLLKKLTRASCNARAASAAACRDAEERSGGKDGGSGGGGASLLSAAAAAAAAAATSQRPGVCEHARPKSFMRDEVDEFDRIFSELLFSSRVLSMGQGGSEFCSCAEPKFSSPSSCLSGGGGGSPSGGAEKRSPKTFGGVVCERCGQPIRALTGKVGCTGRRSPDGGRTPTNSPAGSRERTPTNSPTPANQPPGSRPPRVTVKPIEHPKGSSSPDARPTNPGGATINLNRLWNDNDKLFSQLLDDLDNLGANSASLRRRRKARDLFSDWLFSKDARGQTGRPETQQAPAASSSAAMRKCRESMREFTNRRSAELLDFDVRRPEMFPAKWRPRSFEYHSEDDADSGYHTGSSTLQSHAQKKAPPGEWTLTREDLRHNIETFNNNNHGLIMSLAQHQDSNTFQGFIRVHMNLIRPINMSLSARPASIYDVIGQGSEEGEEQAGSDNAQTTSFYLPKDTTKVIHIQSDTTTQEVIRTLLSKFAITDNPRKFALYEKIVRDGGKKETMRRLDSDERPLPLCLSWTSDGINGLDIRRFVLQENDTGEIMWEAFSLPELENFLKILDREEDEYMEQVKEKYTLLKIQMERRLKELEPETTTMTAGDPETGADGEGDDKRVPVFV